MTSRVLLRQPVRIACIQLASTADKTRNIQNARALVQSAVDRGAKIVVLPECFNSPYSTADFPRYAESLSPDGRENSPTFQALASMARDASVYLIGGSIPERGDNHDIYNTSLVFSPLGEHIGSHRKAHLFDVDFPGQMTFRESDVLSAGSSITVVDLEDYGLIGLGICFDIRFAELSMIAARKHAFALVFPSAFNTTTGPLHWELLARSRAVDNQLFVAMCSQSRQDTGYPAWGHSMIVDPVGRVMSTTSHGEDIIFADLDDGMIQKARQQIPLGSQRRFDLYPDISKAL